MANDKVSVVVPLYNYRQYIAELIESILCQTYKNWELIIADDGSKDNPYPVIEPYLNDKIKYIKMDKNRGYSAAKNVGIRNSSGDMIAVLDADDMLPPKSLQYRVEYLQSHQSVWVYGIALEFHDRKPYEFHLVKRESYKRQRKMHKTGDDSGIWTCIHAQTVMVMRSAYEKVGLYEESLPSMGDKEMWARLLHNVGKPTYAKKVVAYYRQHSQQMHRSKKKLMNVSTLKEHVHKLIEQRKKSLEGVERL